MKSETKTIEPWRQPRRSRNPSAAVSMRITFLTLAGLFTLRLASFCLEPTALSRSLK